MVPSFDLTCLAQDLMALSGPAEALARIRQAAAEASGQPAFAAHVLPGRPWEQATLAAGEPRAEGPGAAVRSALFAVYRRLSLTAEPLRLDRSAETESMFRALLPDGPDAMDLLPLRNRNGRLTGALVTGAADDATASGSAVNPAANLAAIARIAGPAMEAAWRHTMALRDQERMQLFSETTEESLWDWNVALGDVWWGGNVEQLFGGRARVSKRPDWRLNRIHPEDAERIIASFEAALGSSVSSWSAEYRLCGLAGDMIHVREHVYFLREVDGAAYRAIGTVRDISALQRLLQREKAARADAERASAVKDEFLAMLGHELRNPLAPIVSVLTLLERRAGGPDRLLEILRRQTQHLVRLVDDLLDVSRISTGKVDLARRHTAIDPLIQRALEMVHPLIEQRRHRVDVELAPGLAVEVDPARMTQVLTNLIANAAKYTEPGGHLRVSAAAEDGQAVIRIRDDGIGIAPEFLPVVFDMFSQGRQALDRAQGGLGLGLSIVKNLVKLHGGTVAAVSAGIGQGTEVTVRLPLATSAEPAAKEPQQSGRRGRPARDLLIVDDNEDAAALLHDLLSASGHEVRIAHHPDDALRLFAERHPDIALVDIGLPTMDGYELTRRMRVQPGATGTKFIALTGYGLASDRTKASDAGFDAHVVKPVSPDRLEQLIDELTARTG